MTADEREEDPRASSRLEMAMCPLLLAATAVLFHPSARPVHRPSSLARQHRPIMVDVEPPPEAEAPEADAPEAEAAAPGAEDGSTPGEPPRSAPEALPTEKLVHQILGRRMIK